MLIVDNIRFDDMLSVRNAFANLIKSLSSPSSGVINIITEFSQTDFIFLFNFVKYRTKFVNFISAV